MGTKSRLRFSSSAIAMYVLFFFIASLIASSVSFAQEDEARRLWDSEFLKKRAATKTPAAPRKAPAYRRATPKSNVVDEKAAGEMMGVTIWRLRPSGAEDNKDTRLLLQDAETKDNVEWTPERVEVETAFAIGDRVRLSVESPRDGYLYVIDREQYTDGTMSEPYLIYPTLRNNNAVTAGRVIEMPGKSSFLLKPLRADYKGELLTLIVTPEPLAEIKPGAAEVKLESKMVEQWEKQWGAPFERFEMIGGAGKTYTKAEKEAGVEGRLLTQEDELPQTLYRINAKSGAPLVIAVPLRISK